jgi:hypothetical protein
MTEALDPDTLDRLRRGIPLRLDRSGRFHLGDEPVTHPRVHAAFLAGIDVSDTAGTHEPTLHVGNQWCYLTVDDCPLRATGVLGDATAPQLRLDDGRTLPLDPASIWEDDQGLRCTAPAQRSGRPLAVRLNNTATMDLSAWIEDPIGDQSPTLVLGEQRFPIRHHPPA